MLHEETVRLQQGVTIWWPAPQAQLHPAAYISLLPCPTSSLSEEKGKSQASVPTGASPLIPGILLMSQCNPVLIKTVHSVISLPPLFLVFLFQNNNNCFEPLLRADMRESHVAVSC